MYKLYDTITLRSVIVLPKLRDLTGQKFGKLTAIKYLKKENEKSKWLCKCDCGKFHEVTPYTLVSGQSKSCGCSIHENKIRNDLTGKRFGKLTVIGFSHFKGSHSFWNVKCDCGLEKVIRARQLTSGDTKSCGCIGKFSKRYKLDNDRIYRMWNHMLSRCYNKNDSSYYRYGERGIIVCDEWKNSYHTFREWAINNGYSDELSIDRIDNDGNYNPNNCKFSTAKEQMNNTSTNHRIEYKGEIKTVSQWAELYGMDIMQLENRILRGWDIETALTKPIQSGLDREYCDFIKWNGEVHNISEWAKILGIKQTTLNARINAYGWSVDRAFTTPVNRRKK